MMTSRTGRNKAPRRPPAAPSAAPAAGAGAGRSDRIRSIRLSRAHSPGFTLLEVLVAVVILSVGVVVVLRAFQTSLAATAEARESLWADLLIRRQISELEADLRDTEDAPAAFDSGEFVSGRGTYLWERRVTPVSMPGVQGRSETLYDVAVESWREGSNRRHAARTRLRHMKEGT